MLIYHPVYDVNHCIFRLLTMLEMSDHDKISWNTLRLMDFYYLFPHMLKGITPFPTGYAKYKKVIKDIPLPYETMLNSKRVLFELEKLQNSAVHNLIAKGLIDVNDFEDMKVSRTSSSLPESLANSITKEIKAAELWFEFIVNKVPELQFSGKSGLKSRSRLMEYRYDTA